MGEEEATEELACLPLGGKKGEVGRTRSDLFLQIGPTPTCQSSMKLISGAYPVTCHQRHQLGPELSTYRGHLTPTEV